MLRSLCASENPENLSEKECEEKQKNIDETKLVIDNSCIVESRLSSQKLKNEEDTTLKRFPTVLERYFTTMYCIELNDKPIDPQVVLFHSNRICLLSIATNHPCIKLKKSILRINCNAGKQNRWDNKVSGKGKKGGQKLEPNTVLCIIETTDGSQYKFYSTIKGRLLEMNEALQTNPNLLVESPQTKGHIAVVLSDLSTVDMYKENMLNKEEYFKKVTE